MVVSIGDPNGIVLEPGEVKLYSSGASSPTKLENAMDLVEGWEDQGGFYIETIDPDECWYNPNKNKHKYKIRVTTDTEFGYTWAPWDGTTSG